MKRYFPTPYPQETLVSLVARYAMHTGQMDMKKIFNYFFGNNLSIYDPSVNLIDHLYNRIKPIWAINFRELIENHTDILFDYPFEDKFTLQMLEHKNTRSHDDNYILNERAISAYLRKKLVFCDVCIKEDRKKYGEAYYKTIHSISDVNYCLIHMNLLSHVKTQNSIRWKGLALEYIHKNKVEIWQNPTKTELQKQYEIFSNRYYRRIYLTRDLPFVHNIKWSNYYRNKLIERYGILTTEAEMENVLYELITSFSGETENISNGDILRSAFFKIIRNSFPKRSRKLALISPKEHFCIWFVILHDKNVNAIFDEANRCSPNLPYRKLRKNPNKVSNYQYGDYI